MNKRTFLKLAGTGTLGWLGASVIPGCKSLTTATDASPNSKNWLWMTGMEKYSDEELKKRLAQVKKVGFDAVLPQVYNSHYALFEHENPLVPVKENFLERFIPIAKREGLEVHAWMWTMPCNIPEVVEKHLDWYAVNGKGEPAHTHPAYVGYYKFLCPNHPEAREFVKGQVKALAKYTELDGIHLDYVRLPDVILAEALQPKYDIVQDKEYPEYDYDYSTYSRDLFKAQTGRDPMEIKNPAADDEWRQFRYDSISGLVNNELVPVARAANKQITAAVFPNWESVRQAWHTFDLDAFLPMLYHNFYNADIDWIEEETRKGLERLNHSKPVYSGLFVPSLPPEELTKAILAAMKGGAKGITLFSYGAIKDGHWEVLEKALKTT